RHALPGQVVVGWAEAAADDDDVRSAERRTQHRFDLGHVIADRGVQRHGPADACEGLGDVPGVGVGDLPGQQLRPDRDDLRVQFGFTEPWASGTAERSRSGWASGTDSGSVAAGTGAAEATGRGTRPGRSADRGAARSTPGPAG